MNKQQTNNWNLVDQLSPCDRVLLVRLAKMHKLTEPLLNPNGDHIWRNCRMRSVSCMHRSSSLISGKGDFDGLYETFQPRCWFSRSGIQQ